MKHFNFVKKCFLIIALFISVDFLISKVLITGLNKYYGFDHQPEILINGTSMSMSGFNRGDIYRFTKMNCATYAYEGVSIDDRYAMVSHFFQMFPDGIKTVIYEVNPVVFSKIRTAENSYTVLYPFMDDKSISAHIKEYADTKDYYIHKIIRTRRFDSRLIRLIVMGYLGKFENVKTNKLDTAELVSLIAEKGNKEVIIEQSSKVVFEKTMDLIWSHNSNIVLVMMPMYYIKLQTFSPDGYNSLCNYLSEFCSKNKNITFLDLNRDSLIHNADYFSDQLHFNLKGQQQITDIISSVIYQ
jgi:hypothetical protein